MTMPTKSNCAHSPDGWCLPCVQGLQAQLDQAGRWQPIATVPKDQVVDLFVPWMPNRAGFKGFRHTDCYMREDGQWTSKNFNSEDRRVVRGASHWMPHPEPPRA